MLKSLTVRNFKAFKDETFDLADHLVLAGPNNSGKSTLLQALAAWHLALRFWAERRGRSKAERLRGVGVTRQDFTAIPLREMNLLWTNTSTAYGREEGEKLGKKLGTPRPLEIEVTAHESAGDWTLAFEFIYQNAEMVSVRPKSEHRDAIDKAADTRVVHIPPFSGIGANEQVHAPKYQEFLIGQGKPGDVVRNLLVDAYKAGPDAWDRLAQSIRDIFRYELLPPQHESRTFILCEYLKGVPVNGKRSGLPKLDIASAGSGFHQVLMLLAFIYARPASVLLLDEPDAHLHVVLQEQMNTRIREIVTRARSQLIVATHSEVIIEATPPSRVTSFFGKPHVLLRDDERDEVREALRKLTSLDLLLADRARGVLYVEGGSDFRLLFTWAQVVGHAKALAWFNGQPTGEPPYWREMRGRNPREAKNHFFAIRAVRKNFTGLILLDGDNRRLPERELAADGLTIARWPRYEAESYLLHPHALLRFVATATGEAPINIEAARTYLEEQLPPAVLHAPQADSEFLKEVPASKTLLPKLFEAAGVSIPKAEYYLVAQQMRPDEVHPSVVQLLDQIGEALAA